MAITSYPDSPESVALTLFETILNADSVAISGSEAQPTAAAMLDLSSECLRVASGERVIRLRRLEEKLGLSFPGERNAL
jgi:hypothetical protein